MYMLAGHGYGEDATRRIREACERGGSSLYASGDYPHTLDLSQQLAASDPAGTVSWLLANPGEAAQRRMDDVYSAWAKNDKDAALTSFASLPAGDLRSNALRGIVTDESGAVVPGATVTLSGPGSKTTTAKAAAAGTTFLKEENSGWSNAARSAAAMEAACSARVPSSRTDCGTGLRPQMKPV